MEVRSRVYVEFYRSFGKIRWRLKSVANGQNMSNGSQGYSRFHDMLNGCMESIGAFEYDEPRQALIRYAMSDDGPKAEIVLVDNQIPLRKK